MFHQAQPQFPAVVFDSKGKIISWNAAMEQFSGIEKSQATGKPGQSIFPQLPVAADFENFCEKILGTESPISELSHLNGETTQTYHVSWSTLPDIGYLAVFRDLVKPANMELALTAAIERFKLLANLNSSLVWTCGPDGKRDFFNTKWLRFTGRKLELEFGDGWMGSVDPKQAVELRSRLANALAAAKNYRAQYLLKAADGRYHAVSESAIAQFASDGTFLGFIGYCADASEGRLTKTTIAAMDSPRLFQGSATNAQSPIGMWKLDRSLAITHVNKAACDQLGMSHDQLIGKSFTQTIGLDRAILFQDVLNGAGSLTLKNQQVSTQRAGVSTAFLDVEAWSLTEDKDGEKNIIGIAMSTLEVTDRKRIEQQKEDFVATLVHDLKTPLIGAERTLQMLIEVAQRHGEKGQSEILGLLKSSNHQLLNMVQNLIEIYRYEEGKPRLMIKPLDLAEKLTNLMKEISVLADEKGVLLELELPPTLPKIAGDSIAIRRVCQNLVDNAIKFTERGGSVRISAQQLDSNVVLRITDTGRGIPLKEQSILFTKFGQDKRSRTGGIGSGLGLYLTKQIIDAHDGSLSFISKEGEGTTFIVTLPIFDLNLDQASVASN
ncbi:MAG: PAS domain-containing sensor histidine kinase [Candidatus Obscuribacterales bacterium]|nr:PAS domain-containing sensor histidine kinase [Candidatus Obscuribacterales bacterium]